MSKTGEVLKIVSLTLLATAIGQELAKPPEERTWHGYVGGFVPYDLRPPTPARLREAYWNPDEPRIFTQRVFGVGWGVNLYWIWQWLQAAWSMLQGFRAEEAG